MKWRKNTTPHFKIKLNCFKKNLQRFCRKAVGLTSEMISNFPSLVKGVYPFQNSNYCEDDGDLPTRVPVKSSLNYL